MARLKLRVTQQWHKDFDAPVMLISTAAETGDMLAVDEDAWLHFVDPAGSVQWSREMPFVPAAAAVDRTGRRCAVAADSGTIAVFDRDGFERSHEGLVFQPVSIDLTPNGSRIAVADAGGKVSLIDAATGARETIESRESYRYVRFVDSGGALVAVGYYGEVMHLRLLEDEIWQKNFRCHTRLPAATADASMILVPSPHFGIIVLDASGRDLGLFEVPCGPKCVTVSAGGERIFVINGENELIIFERGGKVLFRQNLGRSMWHIESDLAGAALAAAATSGAVERFAVSPWGAAKGRYLEFSTASAADSAEGPAVRWRSKVFSALGGVRGGELAVTPAARHVALLDVEGNLRIFDGEGARVGQAERIKGYQPSVKASRSHDFVVAASSANLLAVDLRSYTQRRLALKNDWTTHFDIAPGEMFLAVADFFRGVSLYGEDFRRREFFETDSDVRGVAVDGRCRTLVVLEGGELSFYSGHGSLIKSQPYPTGRLSALAGLGRGFAVGAETRVDTFTSGGKPGWSVDAPGRVVSIQPTRSGLVIITAEGATLITNVHGTVVRRMRRRAQARYFSARENPKEIISVESRGRLLTARSTEKRVLWRREMDDDITAMEVSPDGAYVAVVAGINLYVLDTAAGEKPAQERLYLEI